MRVLAHRGYHAQERENTIGAFEAALKKGVDGIETDVWKTADDVLVLFHDRIAPNGEEITSQTHAQLSSSTGFSVPTLEDALSISRDTLWNIELKAVAAWPDVARVVKQHPKHRFLLTSFYHTAVAELARETSEEDCGLIISHQPLDLSTLLRPKRQHDTLFISTIVWEATYLDEQSVASSHALGIATFVYGAMTVTDRQNIKRWNVDGVITDFPDMY